MRKVIYLLTMVTLVLTACSKNDSNTPEKKKNPETYFKITAQTTLDMATMDTVAVNSQLAGYKTFSDYSEGSRTLAVQLKGEDISDTTHVMLVLSEGKKVDGIIITNIGKVNTADEMHFAQAFAAYYDHKLGGSMYTYGAKYATTLSISKNSLNDFWTSMGDYSFRPVMLGFESSLRSAYISANLIDSDLSTSNSFVVYAVPGKLSGSANVPPINLNKVRKAFRLD